MSVRASRTTKSRKIEKINKKLAVLGSTGSVGRQSLEVASHLGMDVILLSGYSNLKLLEEQCRRFSPRACFVPEFNYKALKCALADTQVRIIGSYEDFYGEIEQNDADMVANSLVGISGLAPTLAAIKGKKTVALANKETLVAGGELVIKSAKKEKIKLLPVDSEHSAIFQCLQGSAKNHPRRIILTASGGPFFGKKSGELTGITPAQAVAHPNWSMGAKISVDSATMMNKGLELIEAMHLFGLSANKIDVIIHRESIIHSMVEYHDGSVIAQLARPDMRLCIQYALTYPRRLPSPTSALDFNTLASLTFKPADEKTFYLLALARRAAERGGNLPAALNGANEAAVALFLDGKISFLRIFSLVESAVEKIHYIKNPTIEDIFSTDKVARELVTKGRLT